MADCGKYRKFMAEQVDGTVSESDVARLSAHLQECPKCTRLLKELQRVRTLTRGLSTLPTPPGLVEAVSTRLRTQRVTWWDRALSGFTLNYPRLAVATAVVLIVCVGLAVMAFHETYFSVAPGGQVASLIQPSTPASTITMPSGDEYLQACSLVHGTLEQDRAFWSVEAIQLASYVHD